MLRLQKAVIDMLNRVLKAELEATFRSLIVEATNLSPRETKKET